MVTGNPVAAAWPAGPAPGLAGELLQAAAARTSTGTATSAGS